MYPPGHILSNSCGCLFFLTQIVYFKINYRSILANEINKKHDFCIINALVSECKLCPAGWHLFQDNCYLFPSSQKLETWNNSGKTCIEMNSHLLTLKYEEQKVLYVCLWWITVFNLYCLENIMSLKCPLTKSHKSEKREGTSNKG